MKAITLRNLPPELTRIIRQKADGQHASINKVVISLLENSVGVRDRKREMVLHHDLDAPAGMWSREEAIAFSRTLARQRAIGRGCPAIIRAKGDYAHVALA